MGYPIIDLDNFFTDINLYLRSLENTIIDTLSFYDIIGFTIKGETGDWEVVIGIEVHAQIVSNSKLFSSASTKFGGEHNTQVSFVMRVCPGCFQLLIGYASNKQLEPA